MVASTGAKYVILGHSERRAYYGETVAILEEKVKLALAKELNEALANEKPNCDVIICTPYCVFPFIVWA